VSTIFTWPRPAKPPTSTDPNSGQCISLTPGGSHDQADAEWIVIRTQLRGHNGTPFGRAAPGRPSDRPGSGRPSGVFCMFLLLLISNVIYYFSLPDRETRPQPPYSKQLPLVGALPSCLQPKPRVNTATCPYGMGYPWGQKTTAGCPPCG
jgi:hypothetical protein